MYPVAYPRDPPARFVTVAGLVLALVRTLLATAALTALLSGCGGGTAGDRAAPDEERANTEATAEPEAQPEAECLDVPADLLAGIGEGLTVQGGGSLRNGKAVQSADPEGFLIAADIQGPGLEGPNDIGVWAVNGQLSAAESGLVFAVDGIAREFSEWGAAAAEGSPAANLRDAFRDSPAHEQARDCAEQAG